MQIRVIVPCYNEGEVIVKTYERLTEILSKDSQDHHYDYDLLFVDDGSKDKTINYIQEMATKDKHVKFISFSRNFGKESAMIAGYQHSENCDGVIMIDADLQHPPELIPQMIEGYMDGYDQVIAKRDRTGENQSRKMMTKIYYKLINHFVEDIKLEDGVGDFRLLSQRAVKSLTQLDEYNRFSKGLYEWIGYNTKVFSYENVEREDGESKWSFSKLLNYGIDGLISFNNKPLRAMIYLGLIVFFINLFLVGEYDYIAFYTITQLLIWTLLQLYLNRKLTAYKITDQKFIAIILTIIMSTSLILTYSTSHDSYYMSIPYLAPAIFLIGAILLFYSTFQPKEKEQLKLLQRIKHPILIGQICMIGALTIMMLLTPYWYAFIIVHLLFIFFLLWQNIFFSHK